MTAAHDALSPDASTDRALLPSWPTLLAASVALLAVVTAWVAGGRGQHTWIMVSVVVTIGVVALAIALFRARADARAAAVALRTEAALAAAARERVTIARDLHDVVSHHLGAIAVRAGVAAHLADPDREEAAALTEIAERARTAGDDLRRLVGVLRDPDAAPQGSAQPGLSDLPAVVASAVEDGIDVALHVDDRAEDLDALSGVVVHRIVQEALANVVRHAPGTSATVRVRVDPATVVAVVTNQAAGPVAGADAGRRRPGYGLQGLQERVDLVGGTLAYGPDGNGGWCVRAELPQTGGPG